MLPSGAMESGIILSDLPTRVPVAEHLDSVFRQVDAAQRAGMTYVMIGQHFLFPGSRWLQPVPLLARLSAELDPGVKLATSVMLAPLHHPVILAEELATLDIVSGGRLVVGLGTGYMPEEFAALGIPFEERVPRFEECIALLEALWSQDTVTFEGRFWQLRDGPVHLRPLQQPRPPLWIGAMKRPGVLRAARLGDGWLITPTATPDDVVEMVGLFAEERARLGKPLLPQPLRREIVVGSDQDDAAARAARMARLWYERMVAISSPGFGPGQKLATIEDFVRTGFVTGTAAECVRELRAIADRVSVDPVITRANWPGMSTDEAVAYIESLGEELVPALRELPAPPCVTTS
jgi:alkanesulfonate monooxygenase SsuD/methylene tetrahydromethanopterin reductase-like flavin-dependent oxidoreductase (luciferase family)